MPEVAEPSAPSHASPSDVAEPAIEADSLEASAVADRAVGESAPPGPASEYVARKAPIPSVLPHSAAPLDDASATALRSVLRNHGS